MKTYIEVQPADDSLSLIPSKSRGRNSLLKLQGAKDLNQILYSCEPKALQPKSISIVNMSVYNLKNTYKDKRKIKDAVTVKQMKLLCKQNFENKKIPMLMACVKKNNFNSSSGAQAKRRASQKYTLQIISRKSLNKSELSLFGMKTLTSSMPLTKIHVKSSALRQRTLQNNQIIQIASQAKPLTQSCKSDSMIDNKLRVYINNVRQLRKLHGLPDQIQKQQKRKGLRVKIRRGNNSQLVKWLFKKRWWWNIDDQKQSNNNKYKINFIWSQLKQKSFFQKNLNIDEAVHQGSAENTVCYQQSCHNHFPLNEYLGNKKALFYNMKQYYKQKNINVFQKLPLTFHVTSIGDQQWIKFTSQYQRRKQLKQNNIWILKPGQNSNRGRGITVHQSYDEIVKIINDEESSLSLNNNDTDSKNNKKTYIIQSYIDKPFLYNRRKFDIRCYMLLVNINKTVKGYWYSQGYIRTSSFQFQLNDFNTFVHLTNDAIQNNSEHYGKYEEGNKISYSQFQKYLNSKFAGQGYNLQKQIIPQMKQIAIDSIKASISIVKGQKCDNPVFQVFGLDFMIDRNFKPWLIQINTNPCLQTSCLVLEKVIPRMLQDAFKLSLDVLFPPPQVWPTYRKHSVPSTQNRFQLVYQQSKQEMFNNKINQLPSLGTISQDGQVYDQKQNVQS